MSQAPVDEEHHVQYGMVAVYVIVRAGGEADAGGKISSGDKQRHYS